MAVRVLGKKKKVAALNVSLKPLNVRKPPPGCVYRGQVDNSIISIYIITFFFFLIYKRVRRTWYLIFHTACTVPRYCFGLLALYIYVSRLYIFFFSFLFFRVVFILFHEYIIIYSRALCDAFFLFFATFFFTCMIPIELLVLIGGVF